ncbi:hypothetical protein [Methanosarcina barkeri]|uniref:hypothetical protein n=1 Tax=Methanosarcina barkeri TaxID=2208 RepID=UPI001FB53378|nr:hypothetical protein [Methanosarcina barkeri]
MCLSLEMTFSGVFGFSWTFGSIFACITGLCSTGSIFNPDSSLIEAFSASLGAYLCLSSWFPSGFWSGFFTSVSWKCRFFENLSSFLSTDCSEDLFVSLEGVQSPISETSFLLESGCFLVSGKYLQHRYPCYVQLFRI